MRQIFIRIAQVIRGYLKSKVYSTRPTELRALKDNIGEEITKIF